MQIFAKSVCSKTFSIEININSTVLDLYQLLKNELFEPEYTMFMYRGKLLSIADANLINDYNIEKLSTLFILPMKRNLKKQPACCLCLIHIKKILFEHILILPCMHDEFCADCYPNLIKLENCPICRKKINKLIDFKNKNIHVKN